MTQMVSIIRWAIGLFFVSGFFTYISTGPVSAFLSLLLAIMLIPPAAKFVYSKIPYTFSSKKLVIIGVTLFFVMAMIAPKIENKDTQSVQGANTHATGSALQTKITSSITLKPTNIPTEIPTPTITSIPTSISQPDTSGTNYYINSDGNQVQSPSYSTDNSVPAGATAKCADGTYSFSQHRSGTCSHHGGVSQWL